MKTLVGQLVDLAPFAAVRWWTGTEEQDLHGHAIAPGSDGLLRPGRDPEIGSWHIGLEWQEPRDVRQVIVRYAAPGRPLPAPRSSIGARTGPRRRRNGFLGRGVAGSGAMTHGTEAGPRHVARKNGMALPGALPAIRWTCQSLAAGRRRSSWRRPSTTGRASGVRSRYACLGGGIRRPSLPRSVPTRLHAGESARWPSCSACSRTGPATGAVARRRSTGA